jgi:Domain of unknown function (DUF4249)
MRAAMKYLAVMLLLAGASACERIVSISVPSSPTRLVVEARLERVRGAVSGVQEVHLTTSDGYFSRSAPPPALDATVRIVDSAGRVFPFAASVARPGYYETSSLQILVGQKYTLRISWKGEEFSATETVAAGVAIDSIYVAPADAQGSAGAGPPATGGGLRTTIDFTDPKGVHNYYLWDQFIDGKRTVLTDTTSFGFYRAAASDELYDGIKVERLQPYGGIPVFPGQLILIRQIAISAQAYRFYNTLSTQSVNDGSPFSVQPTSVRGNVSNVTNPSRPALGYFIASEVVEARLRVP